MAPHSSTLAWKVSWREEPGRLQSMGSLRVGHDWATSLSFSCIGEGNDNPLQCSCLENPRDGGAWWLPSMGLHRVGHNWSDLAAAAATQLTTQWYLLSTFCVKGLYYSCNTKISGCWTWNCRKFVNVSWHLSGEMFHAFLRFSRTFKLLMIQNDCFTDLL